MSAEFWHRAWSEGRIGFHEGKPNRFLQRYAGRWSKGRRLLVPLCGKAEDLAYLASLGHAVVGVELDASAARAFFAEHGLEPSERTVASFTVLEGAGIEIWVGDFFATTSELLGRFDAFYDRAALIALPSDARPGYVAHLRGLLSEQPHGLLVALEYEPGVIEGPPFPVPEHEVRTHWGALGVEDLETDDVDFPRFRAAGIAGSERCYWLGGS
ncbi:MAG TPA: hypothetical protein VLC09_02740 [Polyangiaceae bacterium]|nr:hypothetical protein [Polyangiaceae bacterium]